MRLSMSIFSVALLFVFGLTGCAEREEMDDFMQEDPMATEISISIEAEDRVLVNGDAVALDDLGDRLEQMVVNDEAVARIHAAPGVPTHVVDEVQSIVAMVEGIEVQTEMDMYEEMEL